jgi:hypothetical protein
MMKVANSENANKYGIQSLVAFVVQDEKNQKARKNDLKNILK